MVRVPDCVQGAPLDTKAPVVLTITRLLSQLSVAVGANACAAAKAVASSHSTVLLSTPATVVHVGFTISLTITVRIIGAPIQLQQFGLIELNVNVTRPL